ncbi:hypothetical protein DSL72_008488 [Monilinia vaccinii-corymbosi]|uniref:Uncharacterized protein n=1 Tax=Monilinia vaccinii-corymbosi TaxID=61207 RepID=A0A8A3PJX2_9HELO|nr:hypothetical protein DSL72_008488 [Monilinia vaccinii-corymbosi]
MAASEQTPPSTSPQLMNIPLELREKIWKLLLPDDVGPTLYLYKKDYWQHRYATPSDNDPEYDPANDENNRRLMFCNDLLRLQFPIVLVFINCETRRFAVDWARRQGLDIDYSRVYPTISASFDPERDFLHVRAGEVLGYFNGLFELLLKLPPGRHFSIRETVVDNLALSEAAFGQMVEQDYLRNIFRNYLLKKLIIVTHTTSEPPSEDEVLTGSSRWELKEEKGGEYTWHDDAFQFHGSKYAGKEELYELIEEGIKALPERVLNHPERETAFKVQLAIAIKRE